MNCQPHRAGSHGGGSAAKAVSDPVTSAPDDVVHAPPPAPLRPDFRATVGTSTRIPAHGRKCHDGGNSRCAQCAGSAVRDAGGTSHRCARRRNLLTSGYARTIRLNDPDGADGAAIPHDQPGAEHYPELERPPTAFIRRAWWFDDPGFTRRDVPLGHLDPVDRRAPVAIEIFDSHGMLCACPVSVRRWRACATLGSFRASGFMLGRGRDHALDHQADIAATRIYDHLKTRPEDRPTFKVAY
jgi:hypothetical protein